MIMRPFSKTESQHHMREGSAECAHAEARHRAACPRRAVYHYREGSDDTTKRQQAWSTGEKTQWV